MWQKLQWGWCKSVYDFDVAKKLPQMVVIKIDKFFLRKNSTHIKKLRKKIAKKKLFSEVPRNVAEKSFEFFRYFSLCNYKQLIRLQTC